jgi:hypothetical protein
MSTTPGSFPRSPDETREHYFGRSPLVSVRVPHRCWPQSLLVVGRRRVAAQRSPATSWRAATSGGLCQTPRAASLTLTCQHRLGPCRRATTGIPSRTARLESFSTQPRTTLGLAGACLCSIQARKDQGRHPKDRIEVAAELPGMRVEPAAVPLCAQARGFWTGFCVRASEPGQS